MNLKNFTHLALMIAVTGIANVASASININFEGDTVGSAPAVDTTPGNPVTQPYGIGGYDPAYASPPSAASGTILVGTPSGASKEAVLTTVDTNNFLGALWMDVNGFNLVGQNIFASFDVNILAAPQPGTPYTQPKNLLANPDLGNAAGEAGILLGMNAFTSSDSVPLVTPGFMFAAAPTSDDGGVFAFRSPDNTALFPFFEYVEGTQYTISILADYSTGKLNAFVNGMQKLTDYSFWTGGRTNVDTNELFFFLNGEEFASSVALDNIAARVVPEPFSLLVWSALAMIGTAIGMRRHRSAE